MNNIGWQLDLIAAVSLDNLVVFQPNKDIYLGAFSGIDNKFPARHKAPLLKSAQSPEPLFIICLDYSLKDRFTEQLFIVSKRLAVIYIII